MKSEASDFNPRRLTQARERVGLSKSELASEVSLTPRRLSTFENEGAEPPDRTLRRLAEALGYPVPYFFRPTGPEPEQVSFRAQSQMRAKTRRSALATSSEAIEVDSWLRKRYKFDSVDLPSDLAGQEPAAAAAGFREFCGLGTGPAPNLVHLAELHGIRVFSIAQDSNRMDAFSFWHDNQPFVMLNRSGTAERRRWNLAHELGHLVLHQGVHRLPADRGREDDADLFAAELLLPYEGLMQHGSLVDSLDDVLRHKREWRVSALAFVRRLKGLGCITDWRYRNLMIDANQLNLRILEDDVEREISHVLVSVISDLIHSSMSPADIAADLSVPRSAVDELFHGLAPIALDGGLRSRSPQDQLRPDLELIKSQSEHLYPNIPRQSSQNRKLQR